MNVGVIFGKVSRFIIISGAALGIGFGLTPDIIHRPLGELTIADIGTFAVLMLIAFALVRWAFVPTDDKMAVIWAWFAGLGLASVVGLIFLFVLIETTHR